MNNVVAFGFILNNEQMKKILLKVYKKTEESKLEDDSWVSILNYNKEYEWDVPEKIIKDNPNVKKLKLYYNCYGKSDILFSIRTIFSSCSEGMQGTKYIQLSPDQMQYFKEDHEQYLIEFLNKYEIDNVECDWYSFTFKQ